MSRNNAASRPTRAEQADRHVLYQKAVQAPDFEVEFLDRIFRELRGRKPLSLKEDFCGTAYLSSEWVKSDPERTAVGVDIDADTLAWGRQHNLEAAGPDVASRVTLLEKDVREVTEPRVDIVCAFNFSYCLLEKRDELRHYFEQARASLKDDGLLFLDLFGGTECETEAEEETELEDEGATYIWEQVTFNPIDHHMECAIHFEFDDGSRLDNAFTYAWRLWSIPEIRELLEEAGFSKTRIYWERFEEAEDDSDEMEGTGEYYETEEVENQESWLVYIVAEK